MSEPHPAQAETARRLIDSINSECEWGRLSEIHPAHQAGALRSLGAHCRATAAKIEAEIEARGAPEEAEFYGHGRQD